MSGVPRRSLIEEQRDRCSAEMEANRSAELQSTGTWTNCRAVIAEGMPTAMLDADHAERLGCQLIEAAKSRAASRVLD